MKDLMIDSFLSAKEEMCSNEGEGFFEFLGFDFLIDEDFRVWLIEANTNPYLGTPNEYIANLLPEMIDDMLDLTLDKHYPHEIKRERENRFELLYSEEGINKRR